jgi:hypothetical protein
MAFVSAQFARTLERELNAARAELAHAANLDQEAVALRVTVANLRAELAALKAEPQPVPLDRPDGPGWWWVWSKIGNRWEIEWVEHPTAFYRGKWLPATPPPAPSEEGVG